MEHYKNCVHNNKQYFGNNGCHGNEQIRAGSNQVDSLSRRQSDCECCRGRRHDLCLLCTQGKGNYNNEDSDGYVSRDSGLDFETDEQTFLSSRDDVSDTVNNNHEITMRDPLPQTLKVKGQGYDLDKLVSMDTRMPDPNDYSGGSLVKWRVNALRQNNSFEKRASTHSTAQLRNSLHWEEFFGSSLDLTPTLLGIYDKIASSNQNGDQGPNNQSDQDYFLTNEFLQDGLDDQCHSPKPSPNLHRKQSSQSLGAKLSFNVSHDIVRPISRVDWDESVENNNNKIKMETRTVNENDNKKRPLSISSMSSSSTSSLPRRRKRPNLSDYPDGHAGHLDIEKLDNLLYIDDSPEGDSGDTKTDDEVSLGSGEKRTSGGDTDSQISADQSNFGDQSECMSSTLSFHQSDSSLAFTPSNSTNCSTADLSLNSDLNLDDLRGDRPRRSPSRSSQRSPGISRSSSLKQTGHYVSYVQRVVTELVETEKQYVRHLLDIKQGYFQYILDTKPAKISLEQCECLFGNIIEIFDFSCLFLRALEDCLMDPVKVAECFVKNSDGFVIYAEYCTNYPSAVAVLTEVMHDPQLNEIFKQRQLAMGHSLPLGSYLLKPVQRVLKYHLLLQNILKHYSETDPGHEKLATALDHMTSMSHHINEMKRKHEHAVRVQEIQSQLEDYEGEDFTRLGELVLEGSFRMYGVKASRQIFLFNKGVIIAKRKEDGMLSCKTFIPCATLMLVESIPKEPLNFQILPVDNPKGANTIHARNMQQKRKWCQEIKRLILESFATKIPDNVKNLIIETLGKSKEENDFSELGSTDPGKTHMSTPDYLEKRMKTRRKSGGNMIPEILRPQRIRKIQNRNKPESSSPKTASTLIESLLYNKDLPRNSKNDVEHYGYRTNIPGTKTQQKSSESPSQKSKRTLSIQRSQSFQTSRKSHDLPVQPYGKERSNTADSISMDNLSQTEASSDGPVIRTHSFRNAIRISPIRLDSVDGHNNADGQNHDVLTDHKNLGNIPPAVRKSIENELNKLVTPKTLSVREIFLSKSNQENLNGSYMEELNLRKKRGRYASMPVLNNEPQKSPKMSRLCSDGSANSPHIKQLDVKQYFNYNKERSKDDNNIKNNTLTRNSKPVSAFHDAFTNLRKSQENLINSKTLQPKMTLTQPKPFTSTLKNSANFLSTQAKLNKWGNPERFTKGSLSDLSHLKEDPWIRNKHRSYTESKLQFTPKDNSRASPRKERSHEKPINKQIGRLSLDFDSERHERTHSFDGDERTSFSRDNLDWVVYANRNSLPVSGFSSDELNLKYKYCTPPRGSMEPPPYLGSTQTSTPLHHNVTATHTTPSKFRMDSSHFHDYSTQELRASTADSSVSLSATNTSSETCSSPDILKDAVFDDSNSPDKFHPRDHSHLIRSYSTGDGKRPIKSRQPMDDDRPASADILDEVNHIEDSEKIVAEMEHYMKRSTSSSGSLGSSNMKFPTKIPTFERKLHANFEPRNTNRDSCVSSGSASSYESASINDESPQPQNDEGIMDSIKHKITNITSKFTGKKLDVDSRVLEKSPLSSPTTKYKQEDHPTKIGSTLSHNFSLLLKQGHQKSPEPDLRGILKEQEQGSEAIGSRMANTDLDDYATFSLPRDKLPLSPINSGISIETDKNVIVTKQSEPSNSGAMHKKYGRYSNSNLTASSNRIKNSETGSQFQSKSQSRLYSPETSTKNLNIQQSDSAFSIQSVEIDSSTSEDSPRSNNQESENTTKRGVKISDSDAFYERRLSAVFNTDDAFRDSAVYDCDDIDTPPTQIPVITPTNVPIKAYVQQLEEKNKSKPQSPIKVKSKETSAIIKQRIESLAANVESRNRSTSTSRSMSTATSRAHSRAHSLSSSRASSEEKQLSCYALRDYMDSKFPMEGSKTCDAGIDNDDDDDDLGARSSLVSSGKLKPAFSMGRLDQLSTDVDNLVIMKGWVKELIGKFQVEK